MGHPQNGPYASRDILNNTLDQIINIRRICMHQNYYMHSLCMISKFWGQGGETEVSHFSSVNG